MRRDGVIIQQASGPYKELLRIGLSRHLHFAEQWGFDYWPIFGETRPAEPERHVYWEKPSLIAQALEARYKYIVAMDSDVLIVGEEDLRAAFPERGGIGAVWHGMEDWGGKDAYDHFNCGVLYVQNSAMVREFVTDWLREDDQGHYWHDQHAFNNLLRREAYYDLLVTEISRRWHSCPPHFAANPEDAQVMAWHGGGTVEERARAMDGFIRGRPHL